MSLMSTLENEKVMQDTIASLISGISFSGDEKTVVLVGYFDVVFEHHKAIITLIESGMHGSAFALLRLIVEVLYRACWVAACGTEAQISAIHRGHSPFPKMEKLRKKVDRQYNGNGVFNDAIINNWDALNSFTHTGWHQLSRRFNTVTRKLEPVYTDQEKQEVLESAGAHLALLTILVLKHLGLHEKSDVVSRKFVENTNG